MKTFTKKEKIERAKKLDKAIHEGIKKFNITLEPGTYLALRDGDVCGCAIGSAIMATAKTKPQVKRLIAKFEDMSNEEFGPLALELINAGVEESDLRHLEAGFEGWRATETSHSGVYSASTVPFKFDPTNPFFKVGQNLRKEQIERETEKDIEEMRLEAEERLASIKTDLEDDIKDAKKYVSRRLKELGIR